MIDQRDSNLKIRHAMETLLSGQSELTNGKLTIVNLAKEAGVSESTIKRRPDLVNEFRRRSGEIFEVASAQAEQDLKGQLAAAKADLASFRRQSDVDLREFAHQVYALSLENQALRERLEKLGDNVLPIRNRRSASIE